MQQQLYSFEEISALSKKVTELIKDLGQRELEVMQKDWEILKLKRELSTCKLEMEGWKRACMRA